LFGHYWREYFVFWFDFLAAGCAFIVFKELRDAAAGILAFYHQSRSACFASFLYESPAAANRACNIELPAAPCAKHLVFSDIAQTGRARISERAVRAACRAEPRVPIGKRPAVDTVLFVSSHIFLL